MRTIGPDFEGIGKFQTLSISNNQLKCCSTGDSIIKVYSLSGKFLQMYGTCGWRNAGQLRYPVICDGDADGSVLIVDRGNDRLQVMSEQGEFSGLQLHPPVPLLINAVLFNNQLYVTSSPIGLSDQCCVSKYSC